MQESPFAKQDWHSDDFWVKGALSFRKHFVWKCATSIVERVCNEKKIVVRKREIHSFDANAAQPRSWPVLSRF